jgi:hypothetical protein
MTFARRALNLTFQLGQGSFGDGGFDTVEVKGLRVSATIVKAGGNSQSRLDMRVSGMSLSLMNKLSTLGKPLLEARTNIVTVQAESEGSGPAVVFVGFIQEAWVDMAGAPEGVFLVTAFTTVLPAMRPLPPTSFPGTADAGVIASGIASAMLLNFENGGVDTKLSNAYYPGTGMQQIDALARHAVFEYFLDDTTNTLAIWPKGGNRGGEVPEINVNTGMVGYPTHTQNGINIKTLFNPNIVFGRNVNVTSTLTPANGRWTVYAVTHELESETLEGAWFTTARCNVVGFDTIAR